MDEKINTSVAASRNDEALVDSVESEVNSTSRQERQRRRDFVKNELPVKAVLLALLADNAADAAV